MAPPCLSGIFFLVCLFVFFLREWEVVFIRTTTFRSIYYLRYYFIQGEEKQKYLTRCVCVCVLRHDFSFIKYSSFSRLDIKGENKKEIPARKSQKGHGESSKFSCSALTKYKTTYNFFILFSIRIITQDPCWLNKKKNNQPTNHSITLKTRKSLGEPRYKNFLKKKNKIIDIWTIFLWSTCSLFTSVYVTQSAGTKNRGTK